MLHFFSQEGVYKSNPFSYKFSVIMLAATPSKAKYYMVCLQNLTYTKYNICNNEQIKKELSTRVPIFWYRLDKNWGKKITSSQGQRSQHTEITSKIHQFFGQKINSNFVRNNHLCMLELLTLIKWFFTPNFMKSVQKIGTLVLSSFFICSLLCVIQRDLMCRGDSMSIVTCVFLPTVCHEKVFRNVVNQCSIINLSLCLGKFPDALLLLLLVEDDSIKSQCSDVKSKSLLPYLWSYTHISCGILFCDKL